MPDTVHRFQHPHVQPLISRRLIAHRQLGPYLLEHQMRDSFAKYQPVKVRTPEGERDAYYLHREGDCGTFVNWRDSGRNEIVADDVIRAAIVSHDTAEWS